MVRPQEFLKCNCRLKRNFLILSNVPEGMITLTSFDQRLSKEIFMSREYFLTKSSKNPRFSFLHIQI